MKNSLLTFFIVFVIVRISFSQESKGHDTIINPIRVLEEEKTGNRISRFRYLASDKKTYSRNRLKGKTVFINFWFLSCLPCIAEFPALNLLYDTYKSRKDFVFLSFTFENENSVKVAREKYKIDFPVISVSEKECYRLNFNSGFPVNMIINKRGVVTNFFVGGVNDSTIAKAMFKDITSSVKSLLDETR